MMEHDEEATEFEPLRVGGASDKRKYNSNSCCDGMRERKGLIALAVSVILLGVRYGRARPVRTHVASCKKCAHPPLA